MLKEFFINIYHQGVFKYLDLEDKSDFLEEFLKSKRQVRQSKQQEQQKQKEMKKFF